MQIYKIEEKRSFATCNICIADPTKASCWLEDFSNFVRLSSVFIWYKNKQAAGRISDSLFAFRDGLRAEGHEKKKLLSKGSLDTRVVKGDKVFSTDKFKSLSK